MFKNIKMSNQYKEIMKHIVLILLLALPFAVNAQFDNDTDDEEIINPRAFETDLNKKWVIKTKADSLDYELAYMRYCLGKFNRQHSAGVLVTFTGAVITGVSLSQATTTKSYVVPIGGCVVMLVGTLITLNSFRWIKQSAIKPARYGVGISINF